MIGNVVGNYKITAKIGEGGMGEVFKGVDLMLEREVAIKMLRPELASQPAVVERFRTEAVTLAKLNHPNIAMLHNFFRQADHYFMVMEYVRGETLDSVIRRSGAMSVERSVALFCQALEGIEHAHRIGIIHRDIKPSNMMLTETGSIKVMDFGIARVLGSARMTKQGSVIGTIEYMPPEQVRGEETDARSDVYSLGILLYEMLTGRVPFNSKSEYELMRSQIEDAPPSPRTFASHIAPPLEQAIMRSLAKKTAYRFQSAGEFRNVLLNSIGGSSIASDRAGLNDNAPLSATPPPPTVIEPKAAVVPEEILKETRMATDSGAVSAALDNQIKETRLGQVGGAQPFYPEPAVQSVSSESGITQPPASLLSKLNWKHYAGAAVVFLVLVGTAFALVGMSKQGTTPQVTVGQPEAEAETPIPDSNDAPSAEGPKFRPENKDADSAFAPPQREEYKPEVNPLPSQPDAQNRPKQSKQDAAAARKRANAKKARAILDQ